MTERGEGMVLRHGFKAGTGTGTGTGIGVGIGTGTGTGKRDGGGRLRDDFHRTNPRTLL